MGQVDPVRSMHFIRSAVSSSLYAYGYRSFLQVFDRIMRTVSVIASGVPPSGRFPSDRPGPIALTQASISQHNPLDCIALLLRCQRCPSLRLGRARLR